MQNGEGGALKIDPGGPDKTMTLRAVMSRVAVELFEAAANLKTVQDVSGDLATGRLSGNNMMALQKLDLTEQAVRALAEIVLSLSAVASDNIQIDPASHFSTCLLASIVDRLSGFSSQTPAAVELF